MTNSDRKTLPFTLVTTEVPGAAPIDLVDAYSEFLSYYPRCEMQTKRWFVENVREDWVIFDVGANIGYYSILFSRLAPKGRVTAFEPTASVAKLLRNLRANSVENVRVEAVALGRKAGVMNEAVFRIWGEKPECDRYFFDTVDNYAAVNGVERLDCIKIDTDSFDFEVLQGAQKTLDRFNPYVVVELNHALSRRNQSVAEALKWLEDRGYRDAVVLDFDNFVLKRREGDYAQGFTLHFDRRPLKERTGLRRGALDRPSLFEAPVSLNGAVVQPDDAGWSICGDLPPWGYAAAFSAMTRDDDAAAPTSAFVGVEVEVRRGTAGFALTDRDGSNFLGPVISAEAAPGRQSIDIPWVEGADQMVIRNSSGDLAGLDLTVHSVSLYRASETSDCGAPVYMENTATEIDIDELQRVLGEARELQAGR